MGGRAALGTRRPPRPSGLRAWRRRAESLRATDLQASRSVRASRVSAKAKPDPSGTTSPGAAPTLGIEQRKRDHGNTLRTNLILMTSRVQM